MNVMEYRSMLDKKYRYIDRSDVLVTTQPRGYDVLPSRMVSFEISLGRYKLAREEEKKGMGFYGK